MWKNAVECEWPFALHAGLARLHGRMRIHTPMHPGTLMQARMRTYAHTDQ
jgi:hypothetical protein